MCLCPAGSPFSLNNSPGLRPLNLLQVRCWVLVPEECVHRSCGLQCRLWTRAATFCKYWTILGKKSLELLWGVYGCEICPCFRSPPAHWSSTLCSSSSCPSFPHSSRTASLQHPAPSSRGSRWVRGRSQHHSFLWSCHNTVMLTWESFQHTVLVWYNLLIVWHMLWLYNHFETSKIMKAFGRVGSSSYLAAHSCTIMEFWCFDSVCSQSCVSEWNVGCSLTRRIKVAMTRALELSRRPSSTWLEWEDSCLLRLLVWLTLPTHTHTHRHRHTVWNSNEEIKRRKTNSADWNLKCHCWRIWACLGLWVCACLDWRRDW